MRKKQSTDVAVAPPPINSKWQYGQTFIFRFRRIKQPIEFNNLWNLDCIDEAGNVVKQIADADALNFCLENLTGEFEAAGF